MTDVAAQAGVAGLDHFLAWISSVPYHPQNPNKRTDTENEPILLQALELSRNPNGASELELAGIWWLIFNSISPDRPDLCMRAVKAGLLDVGMQALRRFTPVEWICWRTPAGLMAGAIATTLLQPVISGAAKPGSASTVKLVIDSGVPDALVAMLKAFELQGASKVHEANVMTL